MVINTIIDFVRIFIDVITYAIILRAILSWVALIMRRPPNQTIVSLLDQITEPVLAPIRRILPQVGMMDFSPIVAILALQFIGGWVTTALSA
ncbi:YggT family protein [Dehalococcoidia bacterium]|nr:YggT family protein [Dehalococcoidia bacterium]